MNEESIPMEEIEAKHGERFYAPGSFSEEISAEMAAAVARATNYTYSSWTDPGTGKTLYMIRTACSNIKPVDLNGQKLSSAGVYGVNACFFDGSMHKNIGMWNNQPIDTTANRNAVGGGVLTWDGSSFQAWHYNEDVQIDDMSNPNSLRNVTNSKYLNWAQGGIDFWFGKSDWTKENKQVPDYTASRCRTAVMGKLSTNYLYLIVCTGATAVQMRNAISAYHGINNTSSVHDPAWGGLMLDGGQSTQLRVPGTSVTDPNYRAVQGALTLISTN